MRKVRKVTKGKIHTSTPQSFKKLVSLVVKPFRLVVETAQQVQNVEKGVTSVLMLRLPLLANLLAASTQKTAQSLGATAPILKPKSSNPNPQTLE